MENYRLQNDKEFKKVCMLLNYNQENYDETKRAFVKAFKNWYAKLERLNNQLKIIEKRRNELSFKEFNDMKEYIEVEKSKITNTYVEKFCAIIADIPTTINGIEKIVALILKDCMSSQVRRVENWIVNTPWVNNKKVMTTIVEEKGKAITIIPDNLANDSDFMLHFVEKYTCTKIQWTVYRKIGEKLKYDIDFVIDFLKTFVAKYKAMDNLLGLKQDFFQIIKTVYDDKRLAENVFIYENYDFWNAVKELRLHEELDNKTLQSMVKKFTMYYNEDAKKDVEAQKTLNERIEYLVKNPDELSRYQRDDYVLMIKLIKLNPMIYTYASNRLKLKTSFINDAIKIGVTEEIVESERQKILLQREEEKVFSIEAYRQERRKEFEKQYSSGSVNYQKVEEYLYSRDSIEDFCLKKKIRRREFEKILDTICKLNPEIASRRDERKAILQNELKEGAQIVLDKISSDESYIYQFAKENTSLVKVNTLVKYATDKKKIIEIIFNAIISKKFNVNDYIRLFSFDYESAMKKIYKFIKCIEENCPEWEGLNNYLNLVRKEIAELAKYETAYRDCDFLGDKRGVKFNGETKLVEITKERLEEVFKYLQDNDEYICYYTVNEAIKILVNDWIE